MSKLNEQYPTHNWQIPVEVIEYEKIIAALRAELTESKKDLAIWVDVANRAESKLTEKDKEIERLTLDTKVFEAHYVHESELKKAESELAEIKKAIKEIDKLLRNNINDPEPLKPVWFGGLLATTTYGLVAGIVRERDKLEEQLAAMREKMKGLRKFIISTTEKTVTTVQQIIHVNTLTVYTSLQKSAGRQSRRRWLNEIIL